MLGARLIILSGGLAPWMDGQLSMWSCLPCMLIVLASRGGKSPSASVCKRGEPARPVRVVSVLACWFVRVASR